ncbi:MAG: aminotransferase class III-fold pyridoxal phosphate-dependent enzyme, partial [Candidatus Hydrothermarchaeales archaeon]
GETTSNTLLAPFNDQESIEKMVRENDDIACIILEPVIGNAGCILPKDGYLQFLKEITEENSICLLFDEVITGFRLALGGAQERFKVRPDITTLGKILGGGLPIGAITASKEVMEYYSPVGKVYQAGTFNGNPLSMTAGYTAISELEDGRVYKKVNELGERMKSGLDDISQDLDLDTKVYGIASMFQMYFTKDEVVDYKTALKADKDFFLKFQQKLLEKGIFLPPSQYECNFISYAHDSKEIDETLAKVEETLRAIR